MDSATSAKIITTQGVSAAVVDVVTSRRANLHREILQLVSGQDLPEEDDVAASLLYAVAYRPVHRHEADEVDVWPYEVEIGRPLPTLPLALPGDVFIGIDLEMTYTSARQRRRLESI